MKLKIRPLNKTGSREILKQLRVHSPLWAHLLRQYIERLERRKTRAPQGTEEGK